jgi:hypothetical protein
MELQRQLQLAAAVPTVLQGVAGPGYTPLPTCGAVAWRIDGPEDRSVHVPDHE